MFIFFLRFGCGGLYVKALLGRQADIHLFYVMFGQLSSVVFLVCPAWMALSGPNRWLCKSEQRY